MFRKLKLKIFGRSKILGTRIKALAENTANPESFYHFSYFSEEVVCRECGEIFIHTADEKRKWFEEDKGNIYKKFIRCRHCDEKIHPERYA